MPSAPQTMDRGREIQNQILRITMLRARIELHKTAKRKRDGIWRRMGTELQKKLAKELEVLERLERGRDAD